jgi:hypothetical protein
MSGDLSRRIGEKALEVPPARIVLTLLALPFYVLGALLGLLLVAGLWAVGAVRVGLNDVRTRLVPEQPVTVPVTEQAAVPASWES